MFNPFSGGFFNTMSHLPGRVLNFKFPRARPFYLGYRKKEICGVSCHKNTKFLQAIAVTYIWSLTPQLEMLR
jgi:hypothetical protein